MIIKRKCFNDPSKKEAGSSSLGDLKLSNSSRELYRIANERADIPDYVDSNDDLISWRADQVANSEANAAVGNGFDASRYLKEHPELIGTEDGKRLEAIIKRGEEFKLRRDPKSNQIVESPARQKLRKDWENSLRTIVKSREDDKKKIEGWINGSKDSHKPYNPKTDKPLVEIKDVPIITEPEEEENDTLALAHQVRFNEEQKKKLLSGSGNESTGKKYDPKTDKPLVEIKETPIITEPVEKERTKELNKFRRDRKREEFVNKVKEVPGKIKNKYDSLSDKYSENFDGRSLGKDAAIAAGATAALGAGAYGLHKYLKKKKADKKKAEEKFKK